jgi:hypothetical protein
MILGGESLSGIRWILRPGTKTGYDRLESPLRPRGASGRHLGGGGSEGFSKCSCFFFGFIDLFPPIRNSWTACLSLNDAMRYKDSFFFFLGLYFIFHERIFMNQLPNFKILHF